MKTSLFLFLCVSLLVVFVGCTSKKSLDEIQKRGNLYYSKNSEKLFTGLLYADYGKDTSWFKKEIKKGMMDGKAEFWYRTKQKKYELEYKENKPNGIALGWYENGVQWFRGSLINGNLDGVIEIRNDQNQIILSSNYSNGKRNGKWSEFYSDGKIKNEGEFKDGIQVGIWTYFNEDSYPLLKGEYKEGKKIGKWICFDKKDQNHPIEITFINDCPIIDTYKLYEDINPNESGFSYDNSDNYTGNYPKEYINQVLNNGMKIILTNLLPYTSMTTIQLGYASHLVPSNDGFFAFKPESNFGSKSFDNSESNDMFGFARESFLFRGQPITSTNNFTLVFFESPIRDDQMNVIKQTIEPEEKNNFLETISIIGDFNRFRIILGAGQLYFENPTIYSFSNSESKPLVDESKLIQTGKLKNEIFTNIGQVIIQQAMIEIVEDKLELNSNSNEEESENIEGITDCNTFIVKYEEFVLKYADMVIKYQKNPSDSELYRKTLALYMEAQNWIAKGDECAKDPIFAAKVAEINMKLIEKMQQVEMK